MNKTALAVVGGFDVVLASDEPTMFHDPFFGIGLGLKLAKVTRRVVWPRYPNAPIPCL
jgi:hypothetical protein